MSYDEQHNAIFLAAVQGQSARIADPKKIIQLARQTADEAMQQFTRDEIAETERKEALAAVPAA